MTTLQKFYANRTSNPASLNKAEAIAKFSIFLDKLAASFNHDADAMAFIEASISLEASMLSFIKAKVHGDYHPACYRLMDETFTGMADYYRLLADQPGGA